MEICDYNICTGCSACKSVCPVGAISFVNDNYNNAKIPKIDESVCIKCNKCLSVCPNNVLESHKNNIKNIYAVWSKNEQDLKGAASAGLVTTLSKFFVKNGGVVFGTCFKDNKLIFDYADEEDKIDCFKGSKYVQAEIGDTFKKIKELLLKDIKIMFIGTPCQIAGLKTFLKKDYYNLFTIDLICHGISPIKFLNDYLLTVLKIKEYDNVVFRGEFGEKLVVYNKDSIVYKKEKHLDYFYMSYAKGLIFRESCYSCKYSSINRVGDITAGDFWGLDRNSLKTDSSNIPYISLLMLNTEKGKQLFDFSKDLFVFEERDINEALAGNKQLSSPCIPDHDRKEFLKNYKKYGFMKSLKKTKIYKNVLKSKFKNIIHTLLANNK